MSDGHVDLEILAELAEGLLDDRALSARDRERAATVRAHLATCQLCQQRAADLAEVQQLLAAVPSVTMPGDVAARIDAAIAAAARDAEPGEDASAGRVVGLRRPSRQRRTLQVAVAAAAAVVIAVGGLATTRALFGGGETASQSSAGGGAVSRDAGEGGSGAGQPPAAAPMSGAGTGPQVIATKVNYSASTMDDQVAGLVRRRMAQGSPGDEAGRVPSELRPLTDPARLRGCIAQATGQPDRRPVVVDLARYEGQPAAVVVFSGPGRDRLDVWVLGDSCSAGSADVLRHTQVPR